MHIQVVDRLCRTAGTDEEVCAASDACRVQTQEIARSATQRQRPREVLPRGVIEVEGIGRSHGLREVMEERGTAQGLCGPIHRERVAALRDLPMDLGIAPDGDPVVRTRGVEDAAVDVEVAVDVQG